MRTARPIPWNEAVTPQTPTHVPWTLQDWEGAELSMFENHQDCWVLRVSLASIDSIEGFTAYMNVFVRCNEVGVNLFEPIRYAVGGRAPPSIRPRASRPA